MHTQKPVGLRNENLQKPRPYRADHVGSFLRPQRLREARKLFEAGEIDQTELTKIEDQEILKVIQQQKDAGLKAITDGEFRRSWWHFDFMKDFIGTRQVEGPPYEFHGVLTPGRLIDIYEPIRYNPEHPFFDHFKFLHENLDGDYVAKFTIPSPNMFFQPNIRNTPVYSGIEELAKDLAEAYRQTIQHFYSIGCRYLQIDDVYWATLIDEKQREALRNEGLDPDEVANLAANVLNDALRDKPADLLVTMHVCRGNFNSAWIYSGGYDRVADALFSVNIDGFFLEYDDERSGGFESLAKSKGQSIVLGLITSKTGQLENPKEIEARILEASQYVPLERLCLSPQCGFSSTEDGNKLGEEQQWEKIKLVVSVADKVWKD